jgi:tRNA pseudouridine55 synthase
MMSRPSPMARKRRGTPIHGWIIFDKPVGMGSTQALAAVRRAAGAEKAGHGGTLDPLASGVLPIALGEATKTVQWVMGGAKRYRFQIRWGEATATDDAEGAVTETSPIRPSDEAIRAALPNFLGTIMQVPSTYSAILVDGHRAYDLARAGTEVTLEARAVRVDSLTVIPTDESDHSLFEVACGKGFYVRSLARDLARYLGTVGHVSYLRRMAVGRFTVERAISLDQLGELGHIGGLSEHLLPVETALDDIPALALTEAEATRLRQGQAVLPERPADGTHIDQLDQGSVVAVSASGKLVGIAKLDVGLLRPMRVLNL